MQDIGLEKTGLNQLIKEGYDLLKLDTFFTSGPEESRAWTVRKNTPAPKAAGVIHTDFEKNFIRAEAVTCEDFIKYEKCAAEIENKYLDTGFQPKIQEYHTESVMKATDCIMEAFKLKKGLLEGLDICINEFEDKRTKKWQTILDKMNEK